MDNLVPKDVTMVAKTIVVGVDPTIPQNLVSEQLSCPVVARDKQTHKHLEFDKEQSCWETDLLQYNEGFVNNGNTQY